MHSEVENFFRQLKFQPQLFHFFKFGLGMLFLIIFVVSFISFHGQATLGLALDILLSEENGLVALQQGAGRLINVVVAVLGP